MALPAELSQANVLPRRVGLMRFCVSVYGFCVMALTLLLATSPVLRLAGLVEFDRLLDAITLVLLLTRALEMKATPGLSDRRGLLLLLASVAYFIAAGMFNWLYSPLFQLKLLLLDGKVMLLLACLWAFADRPLLSERLARRWSTMLLGACVVGTALFAIVGQDGARLKLVDESNYMIVGFSIIAIMYMDAHRTKPGSIIWFATFGFLAWACLIAQSRTGFAVVAALAIFLLMTRRRFGWLLTLALATIAAMLASGEEVVETVTRGRTSLETIDRFIFLQEYLAWAEANSPFTVLFGNHVGTYLTERPLYMNFWVENQSADQEIPYGLAPFNFHSAYLRVLADFGIVPAVAMLLAIYRFMKRSMNGLVVLIVFIGGISMSVFYLSSIMPIMVAAQLIRPARVPTQGEGESAPRAGDTRPASFRT